ncbi:MAG: TldD/PmbA family protein [Caldisericales bacterium]|nr:TldD/PmbA family protein [Caldisericales bacterium]
MIEKIIEEAKKHFQSVEVIHYNRTTTPVSFEAGRLKGVSETQREGYSMRAVKDGKLAFSTTTKPGDVEGLIKQALETIQYSPAMDFDFSSQASFASPVITSKETREITVQQMVDMGKETIVAISGLHPKARAHAGVTKSHFKTEMATNNGFNGSYEKDTFSWGCYIDLTDGDNMLSCGEGFVGIKDEARKKEKIEKLIQTFKHGQKNVKAETGKYPVMFAPSAFLHAINILLASVGGKSVERKVSPWTDKLGTKVTSDVFSLIDDGRIDFRNHSCPYDDEGTPTQRTPLIENGVLKNFLLDKRTAKKLSMKPTGNAFKKSGIFNPPPEIDNAPVISQSTIFMQPGAKPHSDILKNIKKGFYFEELIGTMMGNPLTGQLAGNVDLGFLVENGEIVGRIKDAMVSVNLFEALNNSIAAISSDVEVSGFNGEMVLPYILLDNCTVAIG